MKRCSIVFLVFFVACSNGSEESSEVIETTTTTTQENTTTSTTATTSSTTTTMVEEEYEVDPPKVLITNCPAEDINVDIYELEWTAEAGSGDIVYIGILVEKDDANFTRVFFTKEDNAELITFPTAYTSNAYSYQIDNTDSNISASYIIEINIISEQPNGDQISTYDLCFTNYSPPTTTTTSTSTTTTSSTTTTIFVDTEPPTWPDKTVSIVNLNPTYFEVQWKPASDNVNVAGYRFYLNNIFKGEYIRNNDNNSIFLDGLSAGTSYSLEIIAYDNESNQSIDNPTLTITTTTPTTTTVPKTQYTKIDRQTTGVPNNCEGNSCKLITMCNDSDNHNVVSYSWTRVPGTNSDTTSLLTILSQEKFNNEISTNTGYGGIISEFQYISSETVDSYTGDEWGFIDIYLTCEY